MTNSVIRSQAVLAAASALDVLQRVPEAQESMQLDRHARRIIKLAARLEKYIEKGETMSGSLSADSDSKIDRP